MINEVLDFQKTKALPSNSYDDHFLNIPFTPGTRSINTLLGNANDLEAYEKRHKLINHNTEIEVRADKNARAIITKNDNTELIIELNDLEKAIGYNKGVKKVFVYILYKLSKQQITSNLFEDLSLEFNLRELVEIGLYKNMDTARVGFNNATETLTSLKVRGLFKDKKDQKQITIGNNIEVLFTGATVVNGNCVIYLNQRINWPVFALLYFAPIPKTYFSLGTKPSDLQFYIFTLARIKKNELRNKGFFTIKLRTIQQELGLISEEKTKSPTDKIKNPILKAIEDVNKAENNPDFHITVDYDKNGTIKDFLDNGFITVYMKGDYSKRIIQIAENQEAKIKALADRKDKITAQAQALALAKKDN